MSIECVRGQTLLSRLKEPCDLLAGLSLVFFLFFNAQCVDMGFKSYQKQTRHIFSICSSIYSNNNSSSTGLQFNKVVLYHKTRWPAPSRSLHYIMRNRNLCKYVLHARVWFILPIAHLLLHWTNVLRLQTIRLYLIFILTQQLSPTGVISFMEQKHRNKVEQVPL